MVACFLHHGPLSLSSPPIFFYLQETLTHPSMPHLKVSSEKSSLTSQPEQTSPSSRLHYLLALIMKVAFVMLYLGLSDKPACSLVARNTSPSFLWCLTPIASED